MIILTFEIHDLVVDQDQRNRGLGTRLWQYLIDQAKHCGASSVVLQCDLAGSYDNFIWILFK
jgi:GNAT superfamily N-acetyltransferase